MITYLSIILIYNLQHKYAKVYESWGGIICMGEPCLATLPSKNQSGVRFYLKMSVYQIISSQISIFVGKILVTYIMHMVVGHHINVLLRNWKQPLRGQLTHQ